MILQTIIQSHPKRERYLSLLTSMIDPGCFVSENDVNSLDGCLQALSWIQEDSTHILILQDDALPSKYLIDSARALISKLPNRVISLYSHHHQIESAYQDNNHFLELDFLHGCVAYILPVEIAKRFIEFAPRLRDHITADDVALSTFFHLNDIKVLNTVPSLVDHLGWRESTQSDIRRMEDRVATRFIGLENSGLDIDWDINKVVTITEDRKGHYLTKLK